MLSNCCFQNKFDDFSTASNHILNENKNAVSEKFLSKLQSFMSSKLDLLTTEMQNELFQDGTVYTGSSGLALYYYSNAFGKNECNHEMLRQALDYINIDNLKGRRISFLCGDAGPLALATVISFKLGTRRPDNLPDYKILAQRLISLANLLHESPDELLYGKSGYLYALLFVNKNVCPGKEIIPGSYIEKVIISILKSGKKLSAHMKSNSPLLWQWHDKIYLGAAHGMAGILYMLLQAYSYINVLDVRSYIKPTLDWLLDQRLPSGNFPSSLGTTSGDRLVQWCHGAPGFVPLYLLAHQIFDEDKYLKVALQCGDIVWQRGLVTKGYSLCHGVSGNAYTFIQLYQATKKPIHLYRASCFMEWCAVERTGTELRRPDRPASLFEGIIGRIYLASDITELSTAKFPGLTV